MDDLLWSFLVLESQYIQFMQELPRYSKFEVHEIIGSNCPGISGTVPGPGTLRKLSRKSA